MEALTTKLAQTSTTTNFKFLHTTNRTQPPASINAEAIENHKKTVLVAMAKHMFTHEIEKILSLHRPDPHSYDIIYEDFLEGDIPPHDITKDATYYEALNYVTQQFRPPQTFRPTHIYDVKYHYPHERSSNAEAPFSTEPHFRDLADKNVKGNPFSVGNMYNIIFEHTRLFHHQIKDGANFENYLWYIQLHNRTAIIEKGAPRGIRSIAGFPRPQNIAWIMFLWPYLRWLKERDPTTSPLLWGFETNLGGWFKLNYLLFTGYHICTILTLDKSRFDKFYFFSIQDDIDTMIESFINFDEGYMPTSNYPTTQESWTTHKANRLRRLFRWLTHSFRKCPTLTPHGHLFERQFAGMPSGVYTVQLFDTIYFAITDTDVLLRMGISTNQIRLRKGQGDDIITQFTICVPPNQHQEFLDEYAKIDNHRFGSIIRPEKCEMRNNPQGAHVLGYRNKNGLPVRETLDLIASLYHTKARQITESISMSIAVGIAHASLMHDPRVYKICKNVYDYYSSKGHTMNETWLRRFTAYTGLDLSQAGNEFPTPDKICRSLFDISQKSPETIDSFYPRTHFLADF